MNINFPLPSFQVTRITGKSLLTKEEREKLFQERIFILQERLLAQRQKMKKYTAHEAARDDSDVILEESPGAKRKSLPTPTCSSIKKACNVPDPLLLVGKRVEHVFFILKPGKRGERRPYSLGQY